MRTKARNRKSLRSIKSSNILEELFGSGGITFGDLGGGGAGSSGAFGWRRWTFRCWSRWEIWVRFDFRPLCFFMIAEPALQPLLSRQRDDMVACQVDGREGRSPFYANVLTAIDQKLPVAS